MTVMLRDIQVASDPWNGSVSPQALAWRGMADYRICRAAAIASGQRKSPALPLSLLTAVHQAGLRVDQIAHGTGVEPATVSAALKRNGLTDKKGRSGSRATTQCVHEQLPVAIQIVPVAVARSEGHAPLLKGASLVERSQLRADFLNVSERLRCLGFSFAQIACLSGRSIQTIHQWRIRTEGNYPAPPREVIDDLILAADKHESVIARAKALLATMGGLK